MDPLTPAQQKEAHRTRGLRRGGGRPKGVPNKATVEFRLAARAFCESPAYRASAEQRMIDGRAPHLEIFFLGHAHGKPVDRVELSGGVTHTIYTWRETRST